MKNYDDNIFSEEDNKLFNDFLNSAENIQTTNTNEDINNNHNEINLNDLNINEDDELKNFANSLNKANQSKVNTTTNNSSINQPSSKTDYKNLLENYKKRLKNFGFPDIGTIKLSSDAKEQEKTFQFFDYCIMKKANDLDNYQKYKNNNDLLQQKCDELQGLIDKYKKELNNVKNELKNNTKEKNDYEFKMNKLKEYYEKLMNNTKKENIYLNNKINKILLEKRTLEEKLQTINEMINKYDFNKVKIINNVEITNYIQKNNLLKEISKVKGAEKLAETLKSGYNDSLRELLFEISALKNFIYDYHLELASLLDDYEELDKDLLNMSFLDIVNNVKNIFNINIGKIKKKFGFLDNEEINFSNLDKCLKEEE